MISRQFLRRRVTKIGLFFCFLNNTLLINDGISCVFKRLSAKVFFYTDLFSCVDIKTSIVLKIFNFKRSFWEIFWKLISYSAVNEVGFFVELELVGLGYRIRKITSRVYRFFWGYANYVYLFAPKDVLVEYDADDRFIFFFSTNVSSVNNLSTYLMLLKKISPYRVTGFLKPGRIIRLNSGKQR